MTTEAAKLLDELMGRDRNTQGDKRREIRWEDSDVSVKVSLRIMCCKWSKSSLEVGIMLMAAILAQTCQTFQSFTKGDQSLLTL